MLDPQTPLFREARYLLAEEPDIRDPAIYHSVLAAIATGNTTNGGIANYIGRRSDEITHPLNAVRQAQDVAAHHRTGVAPDMAARARAR